MLLLFLVLNVKRVTGTSKPVGTMQEKTLPHFPPPKEKRIGRVDETVFLDGVMVPLRLARYTLRLSMYL